MCVLLMSFKEAKKYIRKYPSVKRFSVARFQPKGLNFPGLQFLSATDDRGEKIPSPRSFKPEELKPFADALKKGYLSRWNQILPWLKGLKDETIILACWCPESKNTKTLFKQTGQLACHTGLIGKMIEKHRPDITIKLDQDRATGLVAGWKPVNYLEVKPPSPTPQALF